MSQIIRNRFGIERSAEAVRRHAYRIGVSVIEYRVCRYCGGKARKLDKEGLCPPCHYERLAEQQKRRNTVLVRELDESERGANLVRAKRDYDKARQDKHRTKLTKEGYGD